MRRTSMAVIGTVFALTLYLGNSAIHAAQSSNAQAAGAKPQTSISLRKFVFTLALGDVQAGNVQAGPGSTFTPAASKALADLKDFLPYKRYTLLDTIYKIGLSGPPVPMKGVDDGQKFELCDERSGARCPQPNVSECDTKG